MAGRHLPVRPNLEQLRHQAKDLLRAVRRGEPEALAELALHHPAAPAPELARLADAQHALARAYGVASWPRLVLACRVTAAIAADDAQTLRALVAKHPKLLFEDARGVPGNWGPPLSYAANLGRDRLVALLHELGARDLEHALERACLQGQAATARLLHELGARPRAESWMGPAETLSALGLELLEELGAPPAGELRPLALVLETYSRDPEGKHRSLEFFAAREELPDTPVMALHRGRRDLLERHLRRDPGLLARTFAHAEIYPPELGCSADPSLALHGTPLDGATLLHLCVDYDELELARWLLDQGARADAPAALDAQGFGGHTALFCCVVSQAWRLGRQRDGAFAELLLDHGADPNARASLAKRLRFVEDERLHVYRDVTPIGWGERFHGREWVSQAALRAIAARGGRTA
jgi:hypothetical protein